MHQSSFANHIQGEMIGLAVGNHIIKIGSIWGAVADVATPEQLFTVCSSHKPSLMPTDESLLLQDHELVLKAIATLISGQSVELCSQCEWERKAILLSILHSEQILSSFSDGIISLSPLHPNVNDLLQSIWEAFYETDIPYKPTNKQIRPQIEDKQALIVLDDDGKLFEFEVLELMNVASKCTFLIASSTKRIQRFISINAIEEGRRQEAEGRRFISHRDSNLEESLCTILTEPKYLQLVVASIVADGISLFTNLVQQQRVEPKMTAEIDAIVQIIELGLKTNRWGDVLYLVEAVEGAIALSRRWGLWKQVLQWGLQAAQAKQDLCAEAWALHQLGTRALCLGENTDAINYLQTAIQIREFLNDSTGVSIGTHNVNLLSTTELVNPQSSLVENMLSRMNVVVEPSSHQFTPKRVLVSPLRILTTGILVGGGLFAWFNSHRFIPAPVVQTPRQKISTPAPMMETPHQDVSTPAPVQTFRRNVSTPAPSTLLPEYKPTVNPPLTPKINEYEPTRGKVNNSKIVPTTPPTLPTPIPSVPEQPNIKLIPTPIEPQKVELIPTPTPEQPKVEPTLTPTPTPTETPEQVSSPTPIFLPSIEETPTAEVIPTPAITVTPIEEQTAK
ncbi:hypothetical protein [Iningainema tapete]|uniref:Uncharacterized protein n=1 Tax=Iningainema tapete BLCC-T55 TaxID=2748662 RepID=A0A8J7CEP0_9CYAN|nr:hypothetical protein [Iningainema tapete]MBD2773760.1 hypothetical protein [Iningainema tapete BLCC-T55]